MGQHAFVLFCCAHFGAARRSEVAGGAGLLRLGRAAAGECSAETRNACGLGGEAPQCMDKAHTLRGECRNGDCGNCAHGYCRDGGLCRPARGGECRLFPGEGGDECRPRGAEFCLGTGAAEGFEFVDQGRRGAVFKAAAPGGAWATSLGARVAPGAPLAVKMAKAFAKDTGVDPAAETEAEWRRLRGLHAEAGPAGYHPCVMEAVDLLRDCAGQCCTPYLVVDWRAGPTLGETPAARGNLTGDEAMHLVFAMFETAEWLLDHGVYDHDKTPMNFISPLKGSGAYCITWIDMGPVSSSIYANLWYRAAAPLLQAPEEFQEWIKGREGVEGRGGISRLGEKWAKGYAAPSAGPPCRMRARDTMVQDCAPDLGGFYRHLRELYGAAREEGLVRPGAVGSHLSFEGELADRLQAALGEGEPGAEFRKLWYHHLRTNFPR